jgi:dUTPase
MAKLLTQFLSPTAKEPTVAYPGEDLGFDLYASEDVFLEPFKQVAVPTGIAAVYTEAEDEPEPLQIGPSGGAYANSKKFGLEIGDRSGLAAKHGLHHLAGKIDAGYRGEIKVVLILLGPPTHLHPDSIEYMLDNGWTEFGIQSLDSDELTRMALEGWSSSLARRHPPVKVGYQIKAGDKIAQMSPREIKTCKVVVVEKLPEALRGKNGFGSTGK